jgi:GAF domain-containing protein
VLLVEQHAPGMLCSILLLDRERGTLHAGAAPHLPDEYIRRFEGMQIGPNEGSCSAAAYSASTVIVEDIHTHPNWAQLRSLAAPHGLRACWSTPIMSGSGEVLGTFATYYRALRAPNAAERPWVEAATHVAAVAIAQYREQRMTARARHRAEQLACLYFVASSVNEAMVPRLAMRS